MGKQLHHFIKSVICILLQAKIAILQGERKGHENLMHDLIRRIKMLEYALKQERYVHMQVQVLSS